jgi:2'-5' RNA ligase
MDSARASPDFPRLFVAVPIPADVGARVGGVIDAARDRLGEEGRRIRWVQLEGLHVTLRFLGPTRLTRVVEVATALDRAVEGHAAFAIRLAGAGAFPAADRPRALWLGIRSGAEALAALAADFERALVAAGWSLEARAFRPHMTIARTDGVHAGGLAASALEFAAADLDIGFRADRVSLYRSHLGHGPARYEVLHEARLD